MVEPVTGDVAVSKGMLTYAHIDEKRDTIFRSAEFARAIEDGMYQ